MELGWCGLGVDLIARASDAESDVGGRKRQRVGGEEREWGGVGQRGNKDEENVEEEEQEEKEGKGWMEGRRRRRRRSWDFHPHLHLCYHHHHGEWETANVSCIQENLMWRSISKRLCFLEVIETNSEKWILLYSMISEEVFFFFQCVIQFIHIFLLPLLFLPLPSPLSSTFTLVVKKQMQ